MRQRSEAVSNGRMGSSLATTGFPSSRSRHQQKSYHPVSEKAPLSGDEPEPESTGAGNRGFTWACAWA
jgi:hypothetical protein